MADLKRFKRRRKKRRTTQRRRPINLLASVMTTLNLYMGIMSIFSSIGQEFQNAAYFILAGMLFDLLDGFVARVTNSTSEFGKELDSLADIVSFGLAPAVMVFVAYLPAAENLPVMPEHESIVGKTGSYMAIVFVICAALRLARFNTYQSDMRDNFVGLPSPAAGGTLATSILFLEYLEGSVSIVEEGFMAYYALGPLAVILALLMVSTVRYPKNRFKAFVLSPRHAFISLAFWAFVIAIAHYALTTSPHIVLFPVAMTYVLFGVVDTVYTHFTQRSSRVEEGEKDEAAVPSGTHEAGGSAGGS
jgi:CDP-diacylglycerol--serine O-phosphatidyltransferase